MTISGFPQFKQNSTSTTCKKLDHTIFWSFIDHRVNLNPLGPFETKTAKNALDPKSSLVSAKSPPQPSTLWFLSVLMSPSSLRLVFLQNAPLEQKWRMCSDDPEQQSRDHPFWSTSDEQLFSEAGRKRIGRRLLSTLFCIWGMHVIGPRCSSKILLMSRARLSSPAAIRSNSRDEI